MLDYNDMIKLAILFILITLSALFSSAETAITSLNIIKVRQSEGKGTGKAAVLERLFRNSPKIIATILIGNNIVNIGATAIATELTYKFFQGKNVTALVTVVMTLTILVFGEITPKTFSANNPEKVALRLGRPVEILSYVLYPVLKVLNVLTHFIIRLMGGKITEEKSLVSEEEIMTLVDVGEEAGIIESRERKMINSIFEIGDIEASEVMIPRIDMIYLDEEATLEDALNIAIDYGYSRIPVIKDTVDNVTGILYAKDLLASLRKSDEQGQLIDIKTFTRPAYYIPESKKVNELLKEMQKEKVHIAIVLDEYGGTLGLVTIEDILEEIVGDILDEYDAEIDLIEHLSENTLIVNAKASVEEINEVLGMELPEDEYDSIGGYVFNALGRIPVKDDTIEFDDIIIKVLSVHNRRIKQLEIIKK